MRQQIQLDSPSIWERLIRLIYPAKCMICDSVLLESTALMLCDSCRKLLPRYSKGFEPIHEIPYVEKLLASFHYEEGIDKAIQKMKFNSQPGLAKTLAYLVYEDFIKERMLPDFDVIMPVPMYIQKQRKRGYNQSELLARELSKFLDIPVNASTLIKIRQTKPQSSLRREERLVNLEGAFSVTRGEIVENKNILLVDDVLTTGTTINSCAKILYENGASWVFGAVIAIAGK